MKTLNILTLILLIVGGLNWGLVGAFNWTPRTTGSLRGWQAPMTLGTA